MNLTAKTAESAEGAGAPDAAEVGVTLDAVEAKVAVATPAATAGGVTFAQLQQLLNQQAAATGRMMREMQADMQNQISGAIERFEDRSDDRADASGREDEEAARDAHLRAIHREMNEARVNAGADPIPYTGPLRAPAVSSPTRPGVTAAQVPRWPRVGLRAWTKEQDQALGDDMLAKEMFPILAAARRYGAE